MWYSIVLKRSNDITRIIRFNNKLDLNEQFLNIYKTLWDILFNETSDKLFVKSFWSSPFYSFKLFKKFKKATHDKDLIKKYKNFSYTYSLMKTLLVNYNYWNSDDIKIMYILDVNNNLVDPLNIKLN